MFGRLMILSFAITVSLTSCKFDACENVICLNGGVCDSGDCLCEPGFEGHNCETEQRLAFVGDYTVEESCNLGTFNYDVSIVILETNGTDITITNFGDFGYAVNGTVAGTEFEIPSQVHSGDTITGSGSMSETQVNINYTLITDQADTLTCIMTCTPN